MFTISCPPKVIWLGRKGENEFRTIEVEASEWLKDYPNGTVSVVYHRPDGAIYMPSVTTSGNVTSWLVTATDTAIAGKGEVEYRIIDGDVIGKSVKMPTMVSAAINATTDSPAPPPEDWTAVAADLQGQIGDLGALETEAKTSLVDAVNELAQGGGGGGTSDHRQLIHRDAANQHPMSAITGLQTALDAKGTYSKPSGGIPKTDLASGVQTSLSRADTALQTHQSLAGYATESYVQNYHDNTKQDVITDLATIRSGAALGATALQSVPNTYRTASAQDVIDSGKQDKLIAGANITIAADGKTISATGGGGGTSDHTQLANRDANNQHPMSAITGLVDALAAKGTYSKPAGGIPASDLTSAVQTSLGLADTAVQPEAGKGLFSGNYNDLTNKPTIPAVNDGVLTIKQGGVTKGTFSANASTATEINLDAGGGGGDNTLIVTAWLSDYGTPAIIGTPSTTHAEIIDAIENGKDITLAAQIDDSSTRYNFGIARSDGDYWPVVFCGLIPPNDNYWGAHTAVYISVSNADVWSISYDDYQPTTITDSAGYYTTDTVEGALAEIGAKLAAYPSEVWQGGSY